MGSFSSGLKKNIRSVMYAVNLNCYKIAKELFRTVVRLTPSPSNPGPYAQGHLANQWYPSDDGDFSDELDSSASDTGARSLSRIDALSGGAFNGRDGKLTLVNNLSYAYRAEALGWPESDGWKGQIGPYRMVAKSLQIIRAKYG